MMQINSAWLELTGKCQLQCVHCYADSGPRGGHGTLSVRQWCDIVDQLRRLGCDLVQLIGGEPTLHPDFSHISQYIIDSGMRVEVETNMVHMSDSLWRLFESATGRISIATSYYGATPEQHAAVTGSRGSQRRTRSNIARAIGKGIAVRVGVIEVCERQDTAAAVADMRSLGVAEVAVASLRGVGRGTRLRGISGMSELCGHCAHGKLAVLPDGSVVPCVIGREFVVGNAHDSTLADITASARFSDTAAAIGSASGGGAAICGPAICHPDSSCRPTQPCRPNRDE